MEDNKIEAFWTKWYAMTGSFVLMITLTFLWVQSSRNHQGKLNDLYVNGYPTTGYVTNVIDNHLNDGNIHSWDVYYTYWDNDMLKRTGKINEPKHKNILIGDSIYIIYSQKDTKFHVASLDSVQYQPIRLMSAMLRIDNIYVVAPILLMGILTLTQVLYVYKSRAVSR